MIRIKIRKLTSLLLLTVFVLNHAPAARACGPYTLQAVFAFTAHPDFPLERYARGEIGVVQPTYARSYLVAAYRHLSGQGLDPREQAALVELWKDRLDYRWEPNEEQPIQSWTAERKHVPGIPDAPQINSYRNSPVPNDYDAFLNCQSDAFETAAETLAERIKMHGAEHASVKSWVLAQDQVFSNCGEGANIPAALDGETDKLARADRAYQIAAANFYATKFDEARQAFEAIAGDPSSPWRKVAPYLAARSFLRKASLFEEGKKENLGAAEKGLQKVLTDPTLSDTHDDAKRLLRIARLRLRPEEMLGELADSTLRRDAGQTLKQDVWDYTLLLDKYLSDEIAINERKFGEFPSSMRRDDLTDWLMTLQTGDDAARDHALEMWRQTPSLPWLVAALDKTDATHAQAPALIEAAGKLSPDSPAFATAMFHSVRLLMSSGKESEARARLDSVLSTDRAKLVPSTFNVLSEQRTLLARDLDEFLRYAQRAPTAFSSDEDGRELPLDMKELQADHEANVFADGRLLFDLDAVGMLNRELPVALLRQAAERRILPNHLRREVALSAWVRTVLLEDREAGKQLVPLVENLAPELKGFLADEANAKTDAARKVSALYAVLKFPGLRPYVDFGVGRVTPLKTIDSYRDNWWCEKTPHALPQGESEKPVETGDTPARKDSTGLSFLTDAQRLAAARENAKIAAIGAAPNYLARQTIEWARKAPADPRVPEALHLVVKSTRYGCADAQTGALSKAAHDLLHKRYPKSEWAKKTPYWFKAG